MVETGAAGGPAQQKTPRGQQGPALADPGGTDDVRDVPLLKVCLRGRAAAKGRSEEPSGTGADGAGARRAELSLRISVRKRTQSEFRGGGAGSGAGGVRVL